MIKYYIFNLLLYPIEIIIKFYLLLFSREKNTFIILVIGNYASSTTLWLQIISTIFKVNYINNVSSKFFKCILIGQVLNKIFRKLKLKNQSNFFSEDGVTKGYLEPNEFGWYWRNFFTKVPTKAKIKKFRTNLNYILKISDLPFLFKYSMTPNINSLKKNYNYFNTIKNKLIIIYPYRKKRFVVNSILNRKKNLKKFTSTYNYKEKDILSNSVEEQVQRIYDEHKNFLSKFNKDRILYIEFEKFKKNKKIELQKIYNFFNKFDIEMNNKIYIENNLKNLKFKKDIKKINFNL